MDPVEARCKAVDRGPAPPPRWSAVLLGYLAVTAPLAVAGAVEGAPRWPLHVPLHLALLAWAWLVRRRALAEGPPGGGRPRPAAVLADWTLPAALPFLYAELPLLMAGLPGPTVYHDAAVGRWEAALFGGQPAFGWSEALPVPWLSELLHLGYLLYYPLVYLPPALLWLGLTGPSSPARRRAAFHRTVLAMGVAMLAAFLVMIVWPVQGPRYLGTPPAVPEGFMRTLARTVLEAGSSRGAAFPSSHVSLAVAHAIVALRWQPRVGAAAAGVAALLAIGAVYGGFHYLVDVLSGALLGLLAAGVALAPDGAGGGETPCGERG